MKKDIVVRFRGCHAEAGEREEAADIIETLRKENDILRKQRNKRIAEAERLQNIEKAAAALLRVWNIKTSDVMKTREEARLQLADALASENMEQVKP